MKHRNWQLINALIVVWAIVIVLVVFSACAPAPVKPMSYCKLTNPGSELIVYLPVDPLECLRMQQRGQTGDYRMEAK
jgi:hypothetical protein